MFAVVVVVAILLLVAGISVDGGHDRWWRRPVSDRVKHRNAAAPRAAQRSAAECGARGLLHWRFVCVGGRCEARDSATLLSVRTATASGVRELHAAEQRISAGNRNCGGGNGGTITGA